MITSGADGAKNLVLELKTGLWIQGTMAGSDAPSYSQAITGGSQNVGKKHFKKPPDKIEETRS